MNAKQDESKVEPAPQRPETNIKTEYGKIR